MSDTPLVADRKKDIICDGLNQYYTSGIIREALRKWSETTGVLQDPSRLYEEDYIEEDFKSMAGWLVVEEEKNGGVINKSDLSQFVVDAGNSEVIEDQISKHFCDPSDLSYREYLENAIWAIQMELCLAIIEDICTN
jgi:hypothetical protein